MTGGRQPRRRVKFQHQRRVIPIHHQPRPVVALAMNQPATRRLRVEHARAPRQRLLQVRAPPRRIQFARFARVQAKYGERGYRFALLESGHIAQNLLLLAGAAGLASLPAGGFFDDLLNLTLGIDGETEAATYAILAGVPATESSTH